MYWQHFGLQRSPFSVVPDPTCLFQSAGHRLAAAILDHAIRARHGFIVVIGEAGTGKTTLLRNLVARTGSELSVGFVANPAPAFGSVLGRVLLAFGIEASDADSLAMIDQFHLLLGELAKSRRHALIVIDEGQALSVQQLEELRMLSNSGDGQYMPQIVLAGHVKLRESLRQPELQQLRQRVVGECELQPLDRQETGAYIDYRLRWAGAERDDIFEEAACAAVHEFSHGIPRLVNILCEDALTFAGLANRDAVDASIVVGLARDRLRSGILPLGGGQPHSVAGSHDGGSVQNRALAL